MKLLERILVATDFSRGAHDAVQMAVFVAKRFDSEILLLHVVPGTSDRYSNAVAMIRTDVEEELHNTANRIRAEGIQVVHTIVDFGIPFDQINESEYLAQLPADKNAKIVLYCRSGRMSQIAAEELVSLGYTNIWNFKNGMVEWEQAGYEIEGKP